MTLVTRVKNFDWVMILAILFLSSFGLLSLFSSSFALGSFFNFQKQIFFIILGFILVFALGFFDYKILKMSSLLLILIYILAAVSLISIFLFGEKIRGVYGWFKFGQFSLQPVEFVKVILVIILAKYFSMRHIEMYRPLHIIISGIYVLLPASLVFFQPDLGSAFILILLWVGIMILAGIKLRHLFLLSGLGVLIVFLLWSFILQDYQKGRILAFFDPYFSPQGYGYSSMQAKIAIGNGGIFGQGLGYGSQTQFRYLTEPQTDFIFSAISEEFGLAGISFLFLLFSVLFFRIIKLAKSVQNNFAKLFCAGFAILLFSQISINIGMNLGLLPVIGITLPFLSYGGSSLLSLFLGIGILQSIKIETK